MSLYLDGDYGQERDFLERLLDECNESIERANPEDLAEEMLADGDDVEAIAARTKQVCLNALQSWEETATETKHPYVPFTESDVCWCQPFEGPTHPNCPMHGSARATAEPE